MKYWFSQFFILEKFMEQILKIVDFTMPFLFVKLPLGKGDFKFERDNNT